MSTVQNSINETTSSLTVSTGNLTVSLGNISTTAGSITSATTLTASSGAITATSGNIVISSGNLNLPATTATVGQITLNAIPYFHSFGSTTNIFVGYNAGNLTLTAANATFNTAVGYQALTSVVGSGADLGKQNTAIGKGALYALSDGVSNCSLGYNSGYALTTGNSN